MRLSSSHTNPAVQDLCVMIAPMHRTVSSLTAQILEGLGFNMGDQQLGPSKYNPRGHTEDVDFFRINANILRAAGGHWYEPPKAHEISKVFPWFKPVLRMVIMWKRHHYRRWGFKDPRNCLTGRLLWPMLPGPKLLIVTERPHKDIIASLDRRSREVGEPPAGYLDKRPTFWERLIQEYEFQRKPLITKADGAVHYIEVNRLFKPETALDEIEKLAARVGGNPAKAMEKIIFRKE